MYYSDKLKLIAYTVDYNSKGIKVETEKSSIEVWADEISVTSAEFHLSTSSGRKITKVFKIKNEDYNGETVCEFKDKKYDIERPYQKGLGDVELHCSDRKTKNG